MTGRIIAELQSRGLTLQGPVLKRKGGAGPAEGGALLIDGFAVSAPLAGHYVTGTPYSLHWQEDGSAWLWKKNQELCPVALQAPPSFYKKTTGAGVSYNQIALLHGSDCLATTTLQTCRFWSGQDRCAFCGIELSLKSGRTIARKSPQDLAEVAAFAKEHDGVRHVVLTTGCARGGAEVGHLADCARAVKKSSGLPIHAQCLPSPDSDDLLRLHEAGVDTLGLHIETWDPLIMERVAPPKAALGRNFFLRAWRRAVEIFGPGQVSSFLIAGLGESTTSIMEGVTRMADLGVYPFLVPLRPIPGSLMETAAPPPAEVMIGLYEQTAAILQSRGLSRRDCKAGCVRCGACSALTAFEGPALDLVCHPAHTTSELEQAFIVRRQVFVKEQAMFTGNDRDAEDTRSIHLVARHMGKVVGTVRMYPVADEHGHWVGGRLAVLKKYRTGGAGELLVKRAVATVRDQGCTKFTAAIQEKNVPFFKRLGWRSVGKMHSRHGRLHQEMRASLSGSTRQ